MRECAQLLVAEAKRRDVAVVLVGHVTKDGSLAGPRVLEHVVDTVLSFEGDRHHALRLLRAVKHRFGATDELGLFEMTGRGLTGVPDASKLFLADRRGGVAGSVVAPGDGRHRPLLVEVQALTVPVPFRAPARRNAKGSTAAGWPCCSPCSSATPACASPTTTSTRRPSAASASPSRAPTSPSPSPSPARSPSGRSPATSC